MSRLPFQGTVHIPHEDRLQALDALADALPTAKLSLLPLLVRTVRLLIVENRELHADVALLHQEIRAGRRTHDSVSIPVREGTYRIGDSE